MSAESEHNDEGVEGSRCPHCGKRPTDLVREYSSLNGVRETIRGLMSKPGAVVHRHQIEELLKGKSNTRVWIKKLFEELKDEGMEFEVIKKSDGNGKVMGWVRE